MRRLRKEGARSAVLSLTSTDFMTPDGEALMLRRGRTDERFSCWKADFNFSSLMPLRFQV